MSNSETFSVTTEDGFKLAGLVDLPEGETPFPAVVMAHGFASGKGSNSNAAIAERLLAHGIAVVRFDFRGHYDSEGKMEDATITTGLEDLESVMEFVLGNEQLDQTRLGLHGSSYGGAVAELFVARHPGFACVVLRAPATDWAESRSQRLGEDGMKEWEDTGSHTFSFADGDLDIPYASHQDSQQYDLYDEFSKVDCPVLIVHGKKDEAVPIAQSQKLTELIGDNAELKTYPGADHRFVDGNAFNQVADDTAEFFAEHLGGDDA